MKKYMNMLMNMILVLGILVGCSTNKTQQSTANVQGDTKVKESEDKSLQKIKDRGKLIVGVKTDSPPFGYVNEKGEFVGFEVGIAKRLAKDLLGDETKIELVSVTGPNRISYLQSDKVDLIIATLSVSDERAKVIDFSNPYFKTAEQTLTSNKSGIESTKDLAGKKVVVVKGSVGDLYLTKNVPNAELIKFDKNTEALLALKDGRADAYFQDNVIIYPWAQQNPEYRVLSEQIEPTPWAIGIKKGNKALNEWINTDLDALGKEQYMHKLYDEYLKKEFGSGINPDDIVVEGGKLS